MAELGLLLPKSGGPYIYLLKAFGNFPAFMVVWVHAVVIIPASLLVKSLTVAEYISRAAMDDCQQTQGWTKILAALVISQFYKHHIHRENKLHMYIIEFYIQVFFSTS